MGTSVNELEYVLRVVLGFEREDAKDHVRFVLIVNGKIVARTKYSHSWRGSDSMLSQIAKQLHCSSKTLKGLLGKQLGRQDYFREILRNGFIDQADFNSLIS